MFYLILFLSRNENLGGSIFIWTRLTFITTQGHLTFQIYMLLVFTLCRVKPCNGKETEENKQRLPPRKSLLEKICYIMWISGDIPLYRSDRLGFLSCFLVPLPQKIWTDYWPLNGGFPSLTTKMDLVKDKDNSNNKWRQFQVTACLNPKFFYKPICCLLSLLKRVKGLDQSGRLDRILKGYNIMCTHNPN